MRLVHILLVLLALVVFMDAAVVAKPNKNKRRRRQPRFHMTPGLQRQYQMFERAPLPPLGTCLRPNDSDVQVPPPKALPALHWIHFPKSTWAFIVAPSLFFAC